MNGEIGAQGDDEPLTQLRPEAWDRALHAAGTAYIFERRVRRLRHRTRHLNLRRSGHRWLAP